MKRMRSKNNSNIWLALLGPDGCGKSSVIEGIKSSDLNKFFSGIEVIHLRPRLGLKVGQGAGAAVDNPHGERNRNYLSSILKLVYFLFDYTFGYYFKVKPLMHANKLVIFDRYYYDVLIDPRRYRYGGSMWFARFVAWFVPRPNLTILLNASPNVIQARKQEVPFEESVRQIKAYRKLINGVRNGVVINAEAPIDKVIADVNKAVLDCLEPGLG